MVQMAFGVAFLAILLLERLRRHFLYHPERHRNRIWQQGSREGGAVIFKRAGCRRLQERQNAEKKRKGGGVRKR